VGKACLGWIRGRRKFDDIRGWRGELSRVSRGLIKCLGGLVGLVVRGGWVVRRLEVSV
jgi:hypothetical protein